MKPVFLTSLLYFLVLCFLLTAEAQETAEIEKKKSIAKYDRQISNMPLYLSQIEFYPPDNQLIEKARQVLQKKQTLKLQDKLTLKPFHQRNSLNLEQKIAVSEKSFCRSCHLPLPHQKNIRTRSFNNMHSYYIACETCHLDTQKLVKPDRLEYHWFDFNNHSRIKDAQEQFSKFNDSTAHKDQGSIKITPFYQRQVAIITQEHLYVNQLNKEWQQADLQLKAEIKARVHQPLKANGEACNQCHTDNNSLLDINTLGATEEQIFGYQNNTIATFFEHYRSDKEMPNNHLEAGSSNKVDISTQKQSQQKSIQRIRITELLN